MTWGKPKARKYYPESGMLQPIEFLLFAYGSLKYEPKERVRAVTVPGQLRQDTAGNACARFDMPGLVHGVLIRVSGDDLRRYDQRESGYVRIRVTTTDGDSAMAYQYSKPGFPSLKWLRSGKWADARKEKAIVNAKPNR